MDIKVNDDVGVIIARFQIHKLHDAHAELIDYVLNRHSKVIILLGISHIPCSINNPLDFEMRKQMIQELYPNIIILDIKDINNDEMWSNNVDNRVQDQLGPGRSAVLYGSRDSFISHYSGKFPTQELESGNKISATEIRNEISKCAINSADFRAGVIWASQGRYPSVQATVDIAILKDSDSKLLLGQKDYEIPLNKWRLIGGFSEPTSDSFELDARREVLEETGLEVSNMYYIGSKFIDDWRYKNEPDKIKTSFHKCVYLSGKETPGDDIANLRWFYLTDQTRQLLNKSHQKLYDMLISDLKERL